MGQLVILGRSFWCHHAWRWWLAVALGAFVGIAAGRSLKTTVSVVDGVSMAPTYEPGTMLFTAPILQTLERGDIVVVDDGNAEYALKRIVGMPGETVHLWRGCVFVNRRLLSEPYLPKATFTFPDERSRRWHWALGPEEYLVLGDNRLFSVDSRSYGPVRRDQIKSCAPMPPNTVRAHVGKFTLPLEGRRSIQPLPAPTTTSQASS
jgi:signal peptidase I